MEMTHLVRLGYEETRAYALTGILNFVDWIQFYWFYYSKKFEKNHKHLKEVGHTSEFLFGIY